MRGEGVHAFILLIAFSSVVTISLLFYCRYNYIYNPEIEISDEYEPPTAKVSIENEIVVLHSKHPLETDVNEVIDDHRIPYQKGNFSEPVFTYDDLSHPPVSYDYELVSISQSRSLTDVNKVVGSSQPPKHNNVIYPNHNYTVGFVLSTPHQRVTPISRHMKQSSRSRLSRPEVNNQVTDPTLRLNFATTEDHIIHMKKNIREFPMRMNKLNKGRTFTKNRTKFRNYIRNGKNQTTKLIGHNSTSTSTSILNSYEFSSTTVFKILNRTNGTSIDAVMKQSYGSQPHINKNVTDSNIDLNFVPEMDELDKELKFTQNQTKLWNYIRNNYITKPSKLSRNLTSKSVSNPNGLSSIIFKMFDGKKNGTFIEAGAYDGEAESNSLYLEEQGWEGILVECNPIILPILRKKNRHAWIANVCLSLIETPQTLNFSTPVDWPASARLGKPMNVKEMKDVGIDWMKNKTWLEYQIPCFPLYSIIKAVGNFQEIDFLSLDVEGSELAVLKHFPFEKVPIKVLLVEVYFILTTAQKAELEKFMSSKGYEVLLRMQNDYLFALQSLHFKL